MEKYNKCKENKNILVGILGNKNRGKSFLLGRIIGKKNFMNKYGFLVTTQGISANFPEIDGNNTFNIITLDTAGKDNPLLDSSNIKSNNDNFSQSEKDNEKIKIIARDQRVSEIVLSDFIIQESDVLITVLEQLSFAEQEMLKNLINQLKAKKVENNTVRVKKLIVIHNLMNFKDVKTINNFVERILLNSLSFDLRYGKQPMTNFNNEDKNRYIYVQKTDELDKLQIIHIIMGNDFDIKIKKEFNDPAIRYIRKAIYIASQRKIDLIEIFKDFIIKNSQKYFDGNGFEKDSLIINQKENIPEAIVLKDNKKDINLKSVFVDSKGISNFLSTIEPNYTAKIKRKKSLEYYIEVTFEMFGKITDDKIESSISIVRNQHVITIEGKVDDFMNIQSDIIRGNLKYSQFYFQIVIDKYIEIKQGFSKEKERMLDEQTEINENEKLQFNIAKIYNDKKEIEKNIKFGIYKIKYPIKFVKMQTN